MAALRSRALGRSDRLLGIALTVALAVQAGFLLRSEFRAAKDIEGRMEEETYYRKLRAFIEEKPGDLLLGEDLALLPLTGRRIYLHPFLLTVRAKAGKWDQTPLLRSIGERRFGAVVLYLGNRWTLERRWSPEMREAIRTNYRLHSVICEREVWVPCD